MALVKMTSLEEELKRNTNLKKEDIQSLKEWHEKQSHLPAISEIELVLFLHSNYYRVEPTKSTIDAYYTVRSQASELFSNRDPLSSPLQQVFKKVVYMPLAGKTGDGYGVMYGAFSDPDPTGYDCAEASKMLCMQLDLWLRETGSSLDGHVFVVSTAGMGFGHMTRMSLALGVLRRLIGYLQEGLPIRLKAMHFVNANSVLEAVMSMLRPIMKKELQDLIQVHQKPENVENFNIPLAMLPNEAGGKAGPQKELFAEHVKKLIENRDWFIREEKTQRVNEAKRPGGRQGRPERLLLPTLPRVVLESSSSIELVLSLLQSYGASL